MKYDGKMAKMEDKTGLVSITRNRKKAVGTFRGEPFAVKGGRAITVVLHGQLYTAYLKE